MASHWTGGGGARKNQWVITLFAFLLGWLSGVPALAASFAAVPAQGGRIVMRVDGAVESASNRVSAAGRPISVDPIRAAGRAPAVAGTAAAQTRRRAGDGIRLVFARAAPRVVPAGRFDADGYAPTVSLPTAQGVAARQASMAGPLDFLPFSLNGLGTKPRYHVVRAVPPAAKAPPLPRVVGEAGRPLVVIDAGHGGVDPGAINADTGLREKDVTLRIARAIRDELAASGRVRVALTRDGDRYLVLRERFGIARRLHADLFISIHCDSVGVVPGSDAASGASVYTLSEIASDKEAARLATRENMADVLTGIDLGEAGADVSSILIDLTQRETMNSSADFARLLGREAAPLVPLKPNFHRMASLMVLKAPDMPSVLLETGYISNPRDAAFLDSVEGRHRIAEAIERAVDVHFAKRLAAK